MRVVFRIILVTFVCTVVKLEWATGAKVHCLLPEGFCFMYLGNFVTSQASKPNYPNDFQTVMGLKDYLTCED
jgi:hypothetical protein